MTITIATLHAAGHAAIVAAASAALAGPVARVLRQGQASRWSWLAWSLLLLPLLTPALLVGYAYWGTSLSLVRWPWVNEALYVGLLAARFVPVAALVVYFSPPPTLSAEARFCAGMARGAGSPRPSSRSLLRTGVGSIVGPRAWLVHGSGRRLVVAAGVAFLLAFQEFEVASLMGVATWTVWLFDAQVGGLSMADTLGHAAAPVAVELALLTPLAVLLWTRPRDAGAAEERGVPRRSDWVAGAWLVLAAAAVGLFPLGVVVSEVLSDVGAVTRVGDALPEVRVSLAYAAGATAIVLALVGATRWMPSLRGIASLPGLLGSLVLALAVLVLFQRAPLSGWYDTPAPWGFTLVLLLLPLATLLSLLIGALRRREALHLTRLMRDAPEPAVRGAGRGIAWALRGRPWFWAAALLMTVAYFDLAAGALLAPSGDTPVTVTLYNLMHYGHNAVLSVMTLGAVGALLLTLGVGRAVVGLPSISSIPRIRRASSAGLKEGAGG